MVSFRHGREEDEIMGVSFKKDLVVDRVQVFPPTKQDDEKNKLQVHSGTMYNFHFSTDIFGQIL